MSEAWDRIEGLPLRVESYELTGHDREYGELHPAVDRDPPPRRRPGGDRRGRRLRRPRPHRPPRRRPGPRPHRRRDARRALRAARRARPVRGAPRRARRPRATTGAGRTRARRSTWRCARPASRCTRRSGATRSRCASSARPGSPASTTRPGSTTEPIRKRLAKYPGLRVQARPRERLGRRADRRDRGAGAGRGARPQGPLPRHARSTSRPTPSSTARSPRRSPTPTSRTPTSTTRPGRVLEPLRRPDHLGRAAALARRHQGAGVDAEGDQLEAVALRLAAGAARDLRALRRAGDRDLRRRPGRGRGRPRPDPVPRPRSFTPTPRTTSLPRATTTRRCPTGLPTSPMDPAPSATGFRWG